SIDSDRVDLSAIVNAGVLPCLAGIGGFVNSVADCKIRTLNTLSAANIDNVGIRRRDCNGANGLRWLVIKDRNPDLAVIGAFPYTAVDCRHIEDIGLAGYAGDRDGAPGAERAYAAPAQLLIESRIKLLSEEQTAD